MENTYFIYSNQDIQIERLHLCTWEFSNGTALLEIGCEVLSDSITKGQKSLNIDLYIPWLKPQNVATDLYPRLKDAGNSKFIFNDSVANTNFLDEGNGLLGVIHVFKSREPLCLLPISIAPLYKKKKLEIVIDLSAYAKKEISTNIYFRFFLVADVNFISIRKKGLGRSTIIYDQKINEGRNVPDELFAELQNKEFCSINNCFSFHIVPNSYDLSFFDSSTLKNVRTLEYEAFNRYLDDSRVKKDQLMVVFNKKKFPDTFTFFSIFVKERIGAGQFALAILINIICGIFCFTRL